MNVHHHTLQGGVQIDIQVIDIDNSTPDDLVDTFTINTMLQVQYGPITPIIYTSDNGSIYTILQGQSRYTTPATYSGTNGYATITLRFRVVCAENYYRQDCNTFCMAQDNEMGHYICDRQGNKVCLAGFTGGNCSVGEPLFMPLC